MLRLETETGWWLITHPDHARLAGAFAAAWGNAQFRRPEPRARVLKGIACHDDGWRARDAHPAITPEGKPSGEFVFEPNETAVLAAILPHYLGYEIYQMVLDARASEHSARMVAMKNATDNAKQLVKDLTLEYNKVRQASITTELLEITTAQLAVQ